MVSGFGHARVFGLRPKTCPPAADEAVRRTPEKPLVPSSPVRVKLSNNRLKKLFDKVINDTGNTKGSRDV